MQIDQDTDSSTAGASPQSYIESPHSSPAQQVPYLTNYMTVLSCADNTFMDTGGPFLSITEQPNDQFRFRYKSEMVGTHGCIIGKSSFSNRTKTYPSVVLLNYKGRATIKCSLARHNNPKLHPHQLVEDDQERDLCADVNPDKGYEVGFRGMGIIHTPKKEVPALLYKKYSDRLTHFNVRELKTQCEIEARYIDLNIVRLKFSAHNVETDEEICAPVFSEPINNEKSAATNGLKICRMSRTSGRPRGGDDVYILTEKVNKKNIDIRFVELDRGEVCWTGKARFLMSDVHHQYAIVFRTPAYKNPEITSDVKVYVELFRPSDGRSSERIEFTYKAEEVYKQSKKRKANSYSSIGSTSSGNSIKSVSDLPETVIMANQMNATKNNFNDTSTMLSPHSMPQIPVQGAMTVGLSDALYEYTVIDDHQMQISPMLSQPVAQDPSDLKLNSQDVIQINLNSKEIDQLLKVNSSPDEDRDFANFNFNDYCKVLDLPDDGGADSFELSQCIFNSIQLRPDSGRGKGVQTQASSSKSKMAGSEASKPEDQASGASMDTGDSYNAYFTQKDGLEVKRLVKELCEIIRNKTVYKKQIVRAKLDRLFELRLSNGDTFLHMTIRNSILPSMQYIVKLIHSLKMVQLLNETNHLQQTILHLAIVHDLSQHIPYLVSKGCNPMCEDNEGNNAIHYAVKFKTCLRQLLDAMRMADVECDINACNKEKQTALHLAVTSCRSSVKLLLSHKASYSARDLHGRTPLHLAAYETCLTIMETLLEHIPQSDVDAVDGQGYTALQIVCGIPSTPDTLKIVELLLQKGADPLKCEENNESAWKEANNKPEVRELIKKYLPSYKCWDDETKSEPEDEFESADEGDESGLEGMSAYTPELADILDRSGGWRELALRLQCDSTMSWFEKTTSPTKTLLNQIKECREDVTSLSVAKILRDMGELEAANVILRYVDV